jgi:hypothetical protein
MEFYKYMPVSKAVQEDVIKKIEEEKRLKNK